MMKNSKWFVFNLAFCGLGLLMLGAWEVRAADPGPCVCTQDFDPTLCSDGNVYGNSCLATSCAGQTDCVSFPCPTQSGTATLTFGQGVCGLNGLTLENEQVTVSVTNPNLAADPCNAIAIRGVNILHGHHFVGVGSAGASLAADPVVCPVIGAQDAFLLGPGEVLLLTQDVIEGCLGITCASIPTPPFPPILPFANPIAALQSPAAGGTVFSVQVLWTAVEGSGPVVNSTQTRVSQTDVVIGVAGQ